MPLSIYRYHNKECKEKLLKLGLPVSAHSEYNDCNCMIWIKGMTDNTVMPRQTTHLRDWKAAQALLRSEDSASKDTAVHGPTLEDCITKRLGFSPANKVIRIEATCDELKRSGACKKHLGEKP